MRHLTPVAGQVQGRLCRHQAVSTGRAPMAEVEIVEAVPVPIFVADYTPIIEPSVGMDGATPGDLLRDDEALLIETLALPRAV